MPLRRSARVANRGRGRGRGRGQGHGHSDPEVHPEPVVDENQGGVEGANQSVAVEADPEPAPAVVAPQRMTFTRWTSLQVDKFDGSGTPTDAADWLRKVEKVMNGCRLTPEERVFFVPHQLIGLADIWWSGVSEAWPPSRVDITWEVFLQQFRAKYYPESFRDRMSDALNHIQQGSKTVDEYEREFSNIVRFVPTVASDEREKAQKFFRGLNARYREVMGRNPPTTYLTTVEEARGMESEIQLTTIQKSRSGSASSTNGDQKRAQQEGREHSQAHPPKKFWPNQEFQQPQSFKSNQPGQSSSASCPMGSQFLCLVPGQGLICFKCGKPHHLSECRFTRACNRCGKDGHMGIVCKRNPDSIIKWQKSSASSVPAGSSRGSIPSVAPTRGSVQMMATPLAPFHEYPQ
ncbi:hypothetical protein BS78_05G191000 [Paspalum vaginatum]|nr:hypothetical protein BS78_05G191000 [Paspalum vaginatum]